MACNKNHSAIQDIMATLPEDQGGRGRHKCAACAYIPRERSCQSHASRVRREAPAQVVPRSRISLRLNDSWEYRRSDRAEVPWNRRCC